MIDGILNVYKEPGYTSFDVVAKLRGILGQKKIGHTGTLDPMAEGVLLVCLGKATKLVEMLTAGTKEYRAVMRLGLTSDTEDITGFSIVEHKLGDNVTEETVADAVRSFVGVYEQIPPMYSAIKKNGKKLYEYARQGICLEREARAVEIYSIGNLVFDLPQVTFDVHCSKGTYIRSLCRDIGEKLGCGAVLAGLTRSEVHGYHMQDALKLADIERLHAEGGLAPYIIPIDALLKEYPALHLEERYKKYLLNGNRLFVHQFIEKNCVYGDNMLYRIYCGGECQALYRYVTAEHILKPEKMFLKNE